MQDISLHLLDIIQNSISANSTLINISINADKFNNTLKIIIADNGRGMSEELLNQVRSPFITTRKSRRFGLGIPLFEDSTVFSGGSLTINSQLNLGTIVEAIYKIDHIDRIPLGDIGNTITLLLSSEDNVEISLKLICNEKVFEFDTFKIKRDFNDISFKNIEVINWIQGYINEGSKMVFGGVLNEIN